MRFDKFAFVRRILVHEEESYSIGDRPKSVSKRNIDVLHRPLQQLVGVHLAQHVDRTLGRQHKQRPPVSRLLRGGARLSHTHQHGVNLVVGQVGVDVRKVEQKGQSGTDFLGPFGVEIRRRRHKRRAVGGVLGCENINVKGIFLLWRGGRRTQRPQRGKSPLFLFLFFHHEKKRKNKAREKKIASKKKRFARGDFFIGVLPTVSSTRVIFPSGQ